MRRAALDRIRIDRTHIAGSINSVNPVYICKVEQIHGVDGIADCDSNQPRSALMAWLSPLPFPGGEAKARRAAHLAPGATAGDLNSIAVPHRQEFRVTGQGLGLDLPNHKFELFFA